MRSLNFSKSKIIFIRLHSGLGNQLFQYNYLNFLKSKFKIKYVFYDLRFYYPDLLGRIIKNESYKINKKYKMNLYLDKVIKIKKTNVILIGLISKLRNYNSRWFHFNWLPVTIHDKNYEDYLLINKSRFLYLRGVFIDKKLIQKSTIINLRNVRTKLMKEKIKKYNMKNSVSIHIRGGDVLEVQKNKEYIYSMPLSYYKEAINIIETKVSEPNFLLFTNDELYAQSLCAEFQLRKIKIIKRDELNDLEALLLMSYCNHNIIANSSFSYWAAILNENEDKIIIAPKYFLKQEHYLHNTFQKLPFSNWILIDNS